MIVLLAFKSALLLSAPFTLGMLSSWVNFVQVGRLNEILQLENTNAQFIFHVEIDWLVAFAAITGSILSLVATDRIVQKLRQKSAKLDWRDEFK